MLFEGPAISLVTNQIDPPTETELDQAVLQAQKLAHQFGLTPIHDLDGRRGFETFQRLRLREKLRLRTVSHVAMDQLEYALGLGLKPGLGDGWLRVAGLKLFADGALGPRTAAMLAPTKVNRITMASLWSIKKIWFIWPAGPAPPGYRR